MTHTPGPWKVRWYPDCCSAEIETVEEEYGKYRHLTNHMPMSAGPGTEVEIIYDEDGHPHRYSAEACADARLMAAAPDLMDACQMAIEALKDHPQYDNPDEEPSLEAEALELCRAAIAKVTEQAKATAG